jgi:hypothetical protein
MVGAYVASRCWLAGWLIWFVFVVRGERRASYYRYGISIRMYVVFSFCNSCLGLQKIFKREAM